MMAPKADTVVPMFHPQLVGEPVRRQWPAEDFGALDRSLDLASPSIRRLCCTGPLRTEIAGNSPNRTLNREGYPCWGAMMLSSGVDTFCPTSMMTRPLVTNTMPMLNRPWQETRGLRPDPADPYGAGKGAYAARRVHNRDGQRSSNGFVVAGGVSPEERQCREKTNGHPRKSAQA